MFMKRYNTDNHIIVAVCDKNIIGKAFREGEFVLKLDEYFYKGKETDKDEVQDALSCATIANIAGEKSVACAVECGCIDPETIIFIGGIPHAQMVRI
jgi:hypothetical protein